MSEHPPQREYLLLSRGQWDKTTSNADIEAAIAKFYTWYSNNLENGRFKGGSRLSTEGGVVSKSSIITDGPFGESKEVIAGYWIIVARSLREAVEIAAENPCLQYGLYFEIRPLEAERASAYNITNETPKSRTAKQPATKTMARREKYHAKSRHMPELRPLEGACLPSLCDLCVLCGCLP